VVSDLAKPLHGERSLHFAFLALVPMFLVAALACLASARALGRAKASEALTI